MLSYSLCSAEEGDRHPTRAVEDGRLMVSYGLCQAEEGDRLLLSPNSLALCKGGRLVVSCGLW